MGAGFLIIILIGLFVNGYGNYRKNKISYSYEDLKSKNTVISEQEIYDFMNYTIFEADSVINDRREFMKLNCFSLKHSSELKKFINSQPETVLTIQDKKYMKSQIKNQIFLWDQDQLINVWCLIPKDLYEVQEDDILDYWENFRKLYGNYGHHHYSKPIFNKEKNMVIIEHSGQGGWLLGSGDIILFRKEKGKWKLIKEQNLWIS
ncbi:MAG: hypothetical protein CO022_00580 [Flavobacteriales bacterium CG_4_9_14_0_2_um_filter_32_27]|nr:MAG: hypothetical protein CO022_00580 [Flavobacteriales bacterium CG_4_9_14_0_2_um_filter_32_27]